MGQKARGAAAAVVQRKKSQPAYVCAGFGFHSSGQPPRSSRW
jgi:hypothetical protein